MRPVEFAPEEIIKAGQELHASGRNITGFALRQKVGGGNPSRLKQVWDEHINSQTATQAEPVAELPVEVAEEMVAVTKALTDRLAALAIELNDKAVKAAERRVHEVVRSAGEQRAQAERELADASQTVDELEAKLDEAGANVGVLEQRLVDGQAASQAQAVELAQVRERLALTEQTARTAAEEHAVELNRLNAVLEAERKEAGAATARIAKAEATIEQLRQALTDQTTKSDSTIKQLRADVAEQVAKAGATIEQLRVELVTARGKVEVAEQQYVESLKRSTEDVNRADERLSKAEADRDEARAAAAAAREDAAALRGQLDATKTQNEAMLIALKPVAAEGPGKPVPPTRRGKS